MPSSPSVFISYRKDDSLVHANALCLSLELAFGEGTVFYDKNQLQGGDEWAKRLEAGIQQAQVVLVLVANVTQWLGVKTDEFGETTRRIDQPNDWVRRESELARAGGKKIIPVFVGEAKLPPAERLPEPLRFLPELQAHRIRSVETWNLDLLPVVQIITEMLKGKSSGKNHHGSAADPLDEAIEKLGIPEDNTIGCLHLVNCDRIGQAKIFRKNLNRRVGKADFQFYFIGGCPTEMPASFCKRLIYEIIHDRLDGRQDAISYPFQEDADRIRIENLPIGSDLETSRKKWKEYVARRFHFSNTERFETFIETGVPKLPYDFVTAVFEISEKQWEGDEGEIRQYFEWMLQTFRCPNAGVPTFLFFIVVRSPRLHLEASRSPRQQKILAELQSICEAHEEQATLLADFPSFEEQDFVEWVAELDVRNPNNALAVTHALASTFEPGSEEAFLFKNEQKFHAKDIEPVQRRIYDKAAK